MIFNKKYNNIFVLFVILLIPTLFFKTVSADAIGKAANGADIVVLGDDNYTSADAIDVSSHQSWLTQEHFYQMAARGIKTVVIKVTEGTSYTNPYAKSHYEMTKNAGMSAAFYHYSWHSTSEEAANEATYFASTLKNIGVPMNGLIFNDLEEQQTYANLSGQQIISNLDSFFNTLRNYGYTNYGIYTYLTYPSIEMISNTFGNANIWIAQYPYTPNKNGHYEISHKNAGYGAWQFSSTYVLDAEDPQYLDVSHDFNGLLTTRTNGNEFVYRLYNAGLKVHLYTTDANEYAVLAGRGWKQEGVAFKSVAEGTPVYRLYHSGLKKHLYTTDANEYKVLAGRGWRQEGVAFKSAAEGTPVYRLYNAGLKVHLYTTDANEYAVLAGRGWRQEGVAFYSAN